MLVRPGCAEAHAKARAVGAAAAAAHAGVIAGCEVGSAHARNVLQGVGAAVLHNVLGRSGHCVIQVLGCCSARCDVLIGGRSGSTFHRGDRSTFCRSSNWIDNGDRLIPNLGEIGRAHV